MKQTIKKVGITYDLKQDYINAGFSKEEAAEFDEIGTIDAIDNELIAMGFETERIGNVKMLIAQLQQGERWDMVFNICEGVSGIGREAQVPAVLDVYNIPYVFSDVLVLALTLHKGLTKRVVRDAGVPTPDFYLVETETDIAQVNLPYPLFAKPVAEGTGKGISANSRIKNAEQLKLVCTQLLKEFKQPVLVETFLPGREFTVGIVGNGADCKAVGTMEILFKKKDETNEVYSYNSKSNYHELMDYTVPEKEVALACEQTALNAWKALGCVDGGRVDIRMDSNGIPNFIEVNPLAGLNPIDSDLPILGYKNGWTYSKLMNEIVNSAIKRIQHK
ncbi:MAG TPA: D-alanine--D-alanine ligase [Bacteroidales bacterium]|nr:D-alanine--D-alanine ligase [Bacteroidales bacterium]